MNAWLLVLLTFPLGASLLRAEAIGTEVRPLRLERSAFAASAAEDRDRDCLADSAEYRIAQYFRPYLIFDSRENALNGDEPMALFQVSPEPMQKAPDCHPPRRLRVKYVMLFRDDGGYATSSLCDDRHRGDNEGFTFFVDVEDGGKTIRLSEAHLDAFVWPQAPVRFRDGRHPLAFLSAGKHHGFADTSEDGQSSRYSHWGCRDGVNGKGRRVLPILESNAAPATWHNVGEPDAHPADTFVGDLTDFGLWGAHAWSDRPFCGGHLGGCDTESTSSLRGMFLH